MINQLNYNFIKLISKQKHNKLEENYIVTGDCIERRYLKPRINKRSTIKRFGFKSLRKYNLENIFLENIEYFSTPSFILKNQYGYYKKTEVKKKSLNGFIFGWCKKYNMYNEVTHLLLSEREDIECDYNINTINFEDSKFNLFDVELKFEVDTIKAEWLETFKIGDLFKTEDDQEYIVLFKKIKLLNTKRHKTGIFWGLLKQLHYSASVLEGIKNFKYGRSLLKKYFIQMTYVKMLLKYTYIVLKRGPIIYRSFGVQMMRFFFLRLFRLVTKYQKGFLLICKRYKYTGNGKRKKISILRRGKKIYSKGDFLEDLCYYYKNKLKNFCLIIFNYIYKAAVNYLQINKELLLKEEAVLTTRYSRCASNYGRVPDWFNDFLDIMQVYTDTFDDCYFFIKKKKKLNKSLSTAKYKKKTKGLFVQTESKYNKKIKGLFLQTKPKYKKKSKNIALQIINKFKITHKNLLL